MKNATIHDAELDILEIHLVSTLTEHAPFTVYDADNKDKIENRHESESDSESSYAVEAHRGRSSLDVDNRRASRTQNTSKRNGVHRMYYLPLILLPAPVME